MGAAELKLRKATIRAKASYFMVDLIVNRISTLAKDRSQ
jgi:hypothetical protein